MADNNKKATRRGFLKQTSLAFGVSILSASGSTAAGKKRLNPGREKKSTTTGSVDRQHITGQIKSKKL